MEITYWEAIPEHTFGYETIEIWDGSINDLNAIFICSGCNKTNKAKVGNGSAGKCKHCDRVDYWDLVYIKIDGKYTTYKEAITILKKKKLIRQKKRKVIKSTEYTFKQNKE